MEPYSQKYSADRSASAVTPAKTHQNGTQAAFTPKPDTGTLFARDVPEGSFRPNFSGDLNINGVVYQIAGWTHDNNGKSRISLKVSKPL